jgi:DNA mismatch repair protein MutS
MMRQYLAFKEKHADAILLFRMGDFYEMFFEDAERGAQELGLTLTTRDRGKENPIPMAGVPYHAAETYIARLVRRGYRVAVCEQIGDPSRSKGLVDRQVVEIVTPGTAVSDALVEETANRYVAALLPAGEMVGLAAAEVSTGEFLLETMTRARFAEEAARLAVAEWLGPEGVGLEGLPGPEPLRRPAGRFGVERGRNELRSRFGPGPLEDLGLGADTPAYGAAGALLDYLREVRGPDLSHLVRVGRLGVQDHMVLDPTTVRNLELLSPLLPETGGLTLFALLNRTATSLGARRLRAWISRPLMDRERIEERLEGIQELLDRPEEGGSLKRRLREFRDLERLLARAACGKAGPRDLYALGSGMAAAPSLVRDLSPFTAGILVRIRDRIPDTETTGRRVLEAMQEDPPPAVGEGGVFRPGFHAGLDELRERARGGKSWIARLQKAEREATGIQSLKVGFNKVFGYYLEVTTAHQDKVPDRYIRKQTLVNAERYVTPELKEEEEKILSAEEKLRALEQELFAELRREVVAAAAPVQELADAVGETDVLLSLADVARERRYRRPRVVAQPVLSFHEGRHPVVEAMLPPGSFVPHDLALDVHGRQIAIITGPNMAGKSTFLRQAGLMTILAQMGSFVPAESATVGVVDRVFTRVGASDNIARGQSTFMVEMQETGAILDAATERSLVILDEVGRGTSTYDGLSIAWAVTEHLHHRPEGRPRTLFATHYHELTAMARTHPGIGNLTVEVKEWGGQVIFLRRIVEGAADRSYGVHVAELAGLPALVTERARQILSQLETGRIPLAPGDREPETQLTLFEPVGNDLLEELRGVNLETLSPLEALNLLNRWKERYR